MKEQSPSGQWWTTGRFKSRRELVIYVTKEYMSGRYQYCISADAEVSTPVVLRIIRSEGVYKRRGEGRKGRI